MKTPVKKEAPVKKESEKKIAMQTLLDIKHLILKRLDEHMGPRLATRLYRFICLIEDEEKAFNKGVERIIKEYAIKDEKDNPIMDDKGGYKIVDGKQDDCTKEITELQKLEVTKPMMHFSTEEFDEGELKLSIRERIILRDFID